MKLPCACGCGRAARTWHHVVYRQQIKRSVKVRERALGTPALGVAAAIVVAIQNRDLQLPLADECHSAHHGPRPLPLGRLRTRNFRAAAELLGDGEAYEYLRRHYSGDDPRLEKLLERAAEPR